jgi:hypothetical protein
MKSITFPLLILLVSFSACAQTSSLDRFYQKYQSAAKDQDNISVSAPFLLNISFSGNSGSSKSKTGDDWFQKIRAFHCLSIDASHEQEWADLSRALKTDNFEEWFSVRNGKGRLQLSSRDGKNVNTEVVCLLVDKEGKGLFVHLTGHFTAADKDKIRSAFQENTSDGDHD